MDDTWFPAVQASKCPIELIILLEERRTGTMSGVWQLLAYITQFQKTVLHSENPPQGGQTPTSDYKQEVESHVATTCRLGGTLAYGSTLMLDILAAPVPGPTTLQAYVGIDTTARRLYNVLYMDLIVIIIMTKNFGYSSLRKWLAQN